MTTPLQRSPDAAQRAPAPPHPGLTYGCGPSPRMTYMARSRS